MNNKIKVNGEVKRGEIWFVDFGTSIGRTQGGRRPAVIISNSKCNEMSPVITVIALTSNVEKALAKKMPTQVFISKNCGLQSDSIALCEQPRSVDKSQLDFKVGEVDMDTMILIEKALLVQVGIKQTNNICNNQVINTNVNMDVEHAKELLLSVNRLNKVIKELDNPALTKDILLAKKTLSEKFIEYCKKFGKDHIQVASQIKLMMNNKREMALC